MKLEEIGLIIDLHLETLLIIFVIIVVMNLILDAVRKRIILKREIVKCMLILYLLLLIKTVILPIWIQVPYMNNVGINQMIQLIPFRTMIGNIGDGQYIQLVGNLVLLMPLIIGIAILKSGNISKRQLFVLGIFVSLLLELIQLITNITTKTNAHIFDVDDIILNTIGVIIAIIVLPVVTKIWNRFVR